MSHDTRATTGAYEPQPDLTVGSPASGVAAEPKEVSREVAALRQRLQWHAENKEPIWLTAKEIGDAWAALSRGPQQEQQVSREVAWEYAEAAGNLYADLDTHFTFTGLTDSQKVRLPRTHWLLILAALKHGAESLSGRASRRYPEQQGSVLSGEGREPSAQAIEAAIAVVEDAIQRRSETGHSLEIDNSVCVALNAAYAVDFPAGSGEARNRDRLRRLLDHVMTDCINAASSEVQEQALDAATDEILKVLAGEAPLSGQEKQADSERVDARRDHTVAQGTDHASNATISPAPMSREDRPEPQPRNFPCKRCGFPYTAASAALISSRSARNERTE